MHSMLHQLQRQPTCIRPIIEIHFFMFSIIKQSMAIFLRSVNIDVLNEIVPNKSDYKENSKIR